MIVQLSDGMIGRVAHTYADAKEGLLFDLEIGGIISARGVKASATQTTVNAPRWPGEFFHVASASAEALGQVEAPKPIVKVEVKLRRCRCGDARDDHMRSKCDRCDRCTGYREVRI